MGLKWYAVPILADMALKIGGVVYPFAPFNGHYLGTEIAARNLTDPDRYNVLQPWAEACGISTSARRALWQDEALVRLNQALLASFDAAGVTVGDHHELGRAFEQWCQAEQRQGREVPGDWSLADPTHVWQLDPAIPQEFHQRRGDPHELLLSSARERQWVAVQVEGQRDAPPLGARRVCRRRGAQEVPFLLPWKTPSILEMTSHDIDYTIYGDDLQAVEIELDPQETVVAEAGAMNWMEADIAFEARMGDGSQASSGILSGLMSMGKRVLTGESLFMTHFTNQGVAKRRVAFSSPYPGKIMPVNLAQRGGTLMCQKDAFLCAAKGTKVSIAFTKRIGAGFFGGEGFILQKLEGDGMAFLHAGGTVVERHLNNDTLRVDTGCIVGFTPGIDYAIEAAGGLKSMFFGGEGLFLATLRGTGTVYLQTLPFSRLADRVLRHAPSMKGSSKGEGSVLGSLGRMVDGDGF